MYIKKYCYHKSALISSKSTTEIKKKTGKGMRTFQLLTLRNEMADCVKLK